MTDLDQRVSLSEAARKLNIPYITLVRHLKDIPYQDFSGIHTVLLSEVEEWAKKNYKRYQPTDK